MLTTVPEMERYRQLTPGSRALWERASRVLPGGDTRTSIHWRPYPIYLSRGEGSRVWDVDGMERIDFQSNMTSLILGHAHPAVTAALHPVTDRGLVFGAPSEPQVRLAEILVDRIPSIEKVRFTNSGTEATMNCIRAARAFTGRSKIAKAEGGYHGTHDVASVSVRPALEEAGEPSRPASVAGTKGVPDSVVNEVLVFPYNDVDAARTLIEEQALELAAVIIEPVMGSPGFIPGTPEFLAMLREITRKHNIVLIFDEVISFRLSPGGAQAHYGVIPDLTALGKLIGGGLPVGAFGGSEQLMELFDPRTGPTVSHAGTFQGNPMTMAAGIATLEQLDVAAYEHLAALTEELASVIETTLARVDIPCQVTRAGSLYGVHFTSTPVVDYRTAKTTDLQLRERVFLGLMNEGIFNRPGLGGALSTPMDSGDVATFAESLGRVVDRLGSTLSEAARS